MRRDMPLVLLMLPRMWDALKSFASGEGDLPVPGWMLPWIFDGLILLFLLGGFFGARHFFRRVRHVRKSKKKFFAYLLGILCTTLGLTVAWGSFVEPHRLVSRPYVVALSDAPTERVRIAVLSDIHVGPYTKEAFVRRVVARTNLERPDLILLAGDFVSGHVDEVALLSSLRELRAPFGVFAVTGNHDYGVGAEEAVVDALQGPIHFLRNASVTLTPHGVPLTLVGVEDIWYADDLSQALEDVGDETFPLLLLSHNPDIVLDPLAARADLVVAGHTHGGQIRLPFLGPVPPLPTKLGRAFDRGLKYFDALPIFITPGLGESGPRARLFNPPEISIVTVEW